MLRFATIAGVLPLLLLGARPETPPGELRLRDSVIFSAQRGGSEQAPAVVSPCPGEDGGWRFEFQGEGARRGYAEVPLDGDRLQVAGFRAIRLDYRTGAGEVPDLVLMTAAGGYRARLPATAGRWATLRVEPGHFTSFGNVTVPFPERAPRRLRVEAPESGFRADAALDVRSIVLECGGPAPRWAAARTDPAAPEGFLHGPFLLGGNRALLDALGAAGANITVEYSASWPRVTAADHLDYARGTGVGVALALTHESPGRVIQADARLAPLADHPALAAWYVFDEPDGGRFRGLPADAVTPEAIAARSRGAAPVPTLVTCLDPFNLQDYARAATMIATDFFLPAFDAERPLTTIHSDAEAVAETAARTGAMPLLVIQLAHHGWPHVQTPASLRAQALAAVAGGARGVLYFQGAAAARADDQGTEGAGLWAAFLDLSAELSALAPLAGSWTRVPGEPSLGAETGEVRASCFTRGDETWIVLVNLARAAAPVRLAGACLDGARRLEEPGTAWTAPLRDGAWEGSLAPLEGRVLRVVRGGAAGSVPRVTERFPPAGADPLRFDRATVGGTIFPAPDGPVRFLLDGADRTADARRTAGAAAAVRLAARDLADGTHEVTLAWEHAGAPARETWTFEVRAPGRLPFRDDFERAAPGPRWGACDSVPWDVFDEDRTPARGSVTVVDGELRVESVAGGMGAQLRWLEMPAAFRLGVTVRLDAPGTIELQRGDLREPVELPAGESRVEIAEDEAVRVLLVGGREVRRRPLPIDHRGGAVGLGVAAGVTARFDDLEIVAR